MLISLKRLRLDCKRLKNDKNLGWMIDRPLREERASRALKGSDLPLIGLTIAFLES